MTGIDHRHCFRDVVFDGLKWVVNAGNPFSAIAEADFEIVIKNLFYGQFKMTIKHDSDTKSATYKQKNHMTHLRWGEVKPLIAKDDLLGRSIYLYRKDTAPPEFMIEID